MGLSNKRAPAATGPAGGKRFWPKTPFLTKKKAPAATGPAGGESVRPKMAFLTKKRRLRQRASRRKRFLIKNAIFEQKKGACGNRPAGGK